MKHESNQNHVLVVDDDPSMRRLIAAWLTRVGFQVSQAEDGLEAVAAIEAEAPGFVITDWDMPRMTGLELCRRIREMVLPHYVYTIFLTSRSDSTDVIDALDAGADDFLAKPVKKNELLARLRSGGRVLSLEHQLSFLAKNDALTGLAARRTLTECADREWSRARRYGLPLSVVMFDIDFFKRINDTYGHPVGDTAIQQTARLMEENCRASDVLCRYSGDEFVALLPETDEEHSAVWAERLRTKINTTQLDVGGVHLPISCSFGVAERDDSMTGPEDLIDAADQALLAAKKAGRDRTVCHGAIRDHAGEDSASHQGSIYDQLAATELSQVMTPLAARIRKDDPISDVVQYLVETEIGSAPVTDDQDRLVGVISEKDLTATMVHPDCWNRPVAELMRTNVVSYSKDSPTLEAYEFLCRVTIARVFVVDAGHRPVGFLSRTSLLSWLSTQIASGQAEHSDANETKSFGDDSEAPLS